MNTITMDAVKQFILTRAIDIGCVSGGLIGAYYAGKHSHKYDYTHQKIANGAVGVMFGAVFGGSLCSLSPSMILIVPACAVAHKVGAYQSQPQLR